MGCEFVICLFLIAVRGEKYRQGAFSAEKGVPTGLSYDGADNVESVYTQAVAYVVERH